MSEETFVDQKRPTTEIYMYGKETTKETGILESAALSRRRKDCSALCTRNETSTNAQWKDAARAEVSGVYQKRPIQIKKDLLTSKEINKRDLKTSKKGYKRDSVTKRQSLQLLRYEEYVPCILVKEN